VLFAELGEHVCDAPAADAIRLKPLKDTVKIYLHHEVGRSMKRVLFVGLDPATVDFSDPALPPGMTAEKIHAGVKIALADFAGRGWHARNCFIKPDETAIPTIEHFLTSDVYDCVVIGAGVRLPRNRLVLFEAVVNAIHRVAPQAAIAFNTRPEDSGEAASRWI